MILVSAGHDNRDPGAVNPRLGLKEAELATALRNAVVHYLKQAGIPTTADGTGSTNQPLRESIAKAKGKTIAIELHFNAAANTKVSGVEALANTSDRLLAQKLCKAIAGVTGSPLRGDSGYRPENSGQHSRLGFVRAGGIIVEVEFISNDDAMKVYNSKYWLVAKSIAEVLISEYQK